MGVPSVPSSYTHASGTKSASGNNELIAAPGATRRLVIIDIVVQNESATETTVLLKSGSTTQWRGKLVAGAALSMSFQRGQEWRLGANEALNLDLGGANSHGYSVRYMTELAG